jgi:hypothetical protein
MVARWFSRPVGSPSRRAGSSPVARSWFLGVFPVMANYYLECNIWFLSKLATSNIGLSTQKNHPP